ncbi:hypothetical protein H8B02_06225 [Bradyrhizobium sp. Pear77]|uniref:hypothetical protein n=1 Tax=Bradyrhizobium altum TaxID=1571202 RepID=UPI001E2E50E0|nr:hypothetical protein [Bradyrhizobium altum]MCC8953074.1 hypothetical protein [Bradyrhizobium altum]
MAPEIIAKSGDFQAEYEGSIPFTRSNVFNHLRRCLDSIGTKVQLHLLKKSALLFARRGASSCR